MLREALPYLKKFSGKIFIIKAGGQVLGHPDFEQLIKDVATLVHLNIKVVFVFGAGPQFDEKLTEEKISFEKIKGLRITTKKMLPILKEVTDEDAQKIKKLFQKENVEMVRVENFLKSKKIDFQNLKEEHFTGTVDEVDVGAIKKCFEKKQLPVSFSLVENKNCNADDIVFALAKNLKAEKVIFLTGTRGVFVEDTNGKIEMLSSATPEILAKYIAKGDIHGGMIPKVQSAINILQSGISNVHIISGLLDGTLLTEIFTDKGVGTMIKLK